jgi:uncharacterized membrane protein YeaQ/YmgE (transglycosylase-associated protein family)
MIMNLIAWIILGGIAGWLAGVLIGGHGLGTIGTIVLGVIGAFVGGFLISLIPGMDNPLSNNAVLSIPALITAVIGAVVVVVVAGMLMGRRRV